VIESIGPDAVWPIQYARKRTCEQECAAFHYGADCFRRKRARGFTFGDLANFNPHGLVAGTRPLSRLDDLRFRQFTLLLPITVSAGILRA